MVDLVYTDTLLFWNKIFMMGVSIGACLVIQLKATHFDKQNKSVVLNLIICNCSIN
jgi:hypothetical protein